MALLEPFTASSGHGRSQVERKLKESLKWGLGIRRPPMTKQSARAINQITLFGLRSHLPPGQNCEYRLFQSEITTSLTSIDRQLHHGQYSKVGRICL